MILCKFTCIPSQLEIKIVLFSLQCTPKLLFIFNALFIHSRFQERAKSAGNLLSLLWPHQAKQKALSSALAPCLQYVECPSSPHQVGTSTVIWHSPKPCNSALQLNYSPATQYRAIKTALSLLQKLVCVCYYKQTWGHGLMKRTGSLHCKLNLSIPTDGSVVQQGYMT